MGADPQPQPADVIRSAIRGVGIRPLARGLGLQNHMTVANWLRAGRIPTRHWKRVNARLRAAGAEPIPEDVLRGAYGGDDA